MTSDCICIPGQNSAHFLEKLFLISEVKTMRNKKKLMAYEADRNCIQPKKWNQWPSRFNLLTKKADEQMNIHTQKLILVKP